MLQGDVFLAIRVCPTLSANKGTLWLEIGKNGTMQQYPSQYKNKYENLRGIRSNYTGTIMKNPTIHLCLILS